MKRLLVLTALLFNTPALLADTFEFAVSNDSVEASYDIALSNSFSTRISGLYADVKRADIDLDKAGDVRRDTSTALASIGLYNHGKTGPVTTHLGGYVFWIDPDVDNAKIGGDQSAGLALGVAIDGHITPEFLVTGSLHFAPDILTSGHYQNYLAFNTRAAYRVLPSTSLFAGYRYLAVTGDKLDAELYNGPFVGFSFSF